MPVKSRWYLPTPNSCCIYFLAPSHTELGGDRGEAWSHRTVHLVLAVVWNVSMGVLVCVVPKRQIFFMTLVTSAGTLPLVADTIWKCVYVHFLQALGGLLGMLIVLSVTRKVAGRLTIGDFRHSVQLTPIQNMLLIAGVPSQCPGNYARSSL